MIFRTPVELPPQQIQLTPQSHTFFIGSCFADHIGQLMTNCLPNKQVTVNPHGPLYNPISIRQVLASYLPSGIAKPFDEAGFFKTPEGEWRHWDYSTKFTAPTQEALEQMLRKDWLNVQKHFVTTQTLFITQTTIAHVCRMHRALRATHHTLDRLYATLAQRIAANASSVYTKSLSLRQIWHACQCAKQGTTHVTH